MKKSKNTGSKNKSSFNLRRRKLNFGTSVHMLPSKSELQKEYDKANPKKERPQIDHELHPHTSDNLFMAKPALNQSM